MSLPPSAAGQEVELRDLPGTVEVGTVSSGELTTPISEVCAYCKRKPCVQDLGSYFEYFKSIVKWLDQTEDYSDRYWSSEAGTYPSFVDTLWSENERTIRPHLRPLIANERLRHKEKAETPRAGGGRKLRNLHDRWDLDSDEFKEALSAVRSLMETAANEGHFIPKEDSVPRMRRLVPQTNSPSTSHGAITITAASYPSTIKTEVPVTAFPQESLDEDQKEDSEYESGSESDEQPGTGSTSELSGDDHRLSRHAYPQPSEYVSRNTYQPSQIMPASYMLMAPTQVNAYSSPQGSPTRNTHNPAPIQRLPNLIAGNLLNIAPRTESGYPISQAFSTPFFVPGNATSVAEANTNQYGQHIAPNRIFPRLDGTYAPSHNIGFALAPGQGGLRTSLTTTSAVFSPNQDYVSHLAFPGQVGPLQSFAGHHGATVAEQNAHEHPEVEQPSHLRMTIYESELNNPVSILRDRELTPFITDEEDLALPTFTAAGYPAFGYTGFSDLGQYGSRAYNDNLDPGPSWTPWDNGIGRDIL